MPRQDLPSDRASIDMLGGKQTNPDGIPEPDQIHPADGFRLIVGAPADGAANLAGYQVRVDFTNGAQSDLFRYNLNASSMLDVTDRPSAPLRSLFNGWSFGSNVLLPAFNPGNSGDQVQATSTQGDLVITVTLAPPGPPI